jgi:multidrug efflux pump subunit AcrA (membrane-fusion protein)
MSRNLWVIAGAAVLLGVIFVVAIVAFRNGTVGETVEVSRGDIEATVETVGRVEVRDRISLRAPLTTTVEIVAVVPGDDVMEGDVLVQLNTLPFEQALDEAELALIKLKRTWR